MQIPGIEERNGRARNQLAPASSRIGLINHPHPCWSFTRSRCSQTNTTIVAAQRRKDFFAATAACYREEVQWQGRPTHRIRLGAADRLRKSRLLPLTLTPNRNAPPLASLLPCACQNLATATATRDSILRQKRQLPRSGLHLPATCARRPYWLTRLEDLTLSIRLLRLPLHCTLPHDLPHIVSDSKPVPSL